MNAIFIVYWKEVIEALRDRRTLLTTFVIMPLVFPLLFAGMNWISTKKMTEKAEATLELPVAGAERAPNLVAWLRQQNVEVKQAPADVDAAIRNQDFDIIVRIGEDFASSWRNSEPALVEVVYDSSRPLQSGVSINRVQGLLAQYGGEMGSLRLVARGLNPSVLAALRVGHRDLATPENKNSFAQMLLPYLLILLGFIGGMHLAIDSTAGERERQSLEPLLATPASREAIVSGKMLATATFSLLSLVLTLAGYKFSFSVLGGSRMGSSFAMSFGTALQIFAVISPIVLFGACLLTALAAFAKSYREAQSYVPMLYFVPMIPSMYLMMSPVKTELWMLAVPFLAQNQLIVRLIRGEGVAPVEWAVGVGAGLVLVAITWFIAARLYRREQLAISG